MAKKTQHIRVCMIGREEDNTIGVFESNDDKTIYRVPMKDVTGMVIRAAWYASLFISKDGTTKVRMD